MPFTALDKNTFMKEDNDQLERNRPAEEGRRNDPNVRDESAIQPGVQTASSGPNDEANNRLTETASDSFDPNSEFGKNADPAFDEVDKEDE